MSDSSPQLVTAIIPCYNYGHFLGETLDSILNQTYPHWECIIVDDGSTDNSSEVGKAYEAKDARFVYHFQENKGLSASRNTGIGIAKGDFFQFLDADDLIEPEKFEKQVKYLNEHPEVDIVYGNVRYFEKDTNEQMLTGWGIEEEWMPKVSGPGEEVLKTCIHTNILHLSSPLYVKKVVDKIGGFDVEINPVADYNFSMMAAIHGFVYQYTDLPGTRSLVRVHSTSMSKNYDYMWDGEVLMREKLKPFLNDPEVREWNQQMQEKCRIQLKKSPATAFLSGGKYEPLKKIIRNSPLDKLARKFFYKFLS